jgi:transaldolase
MGEGTVAPGSGQLFPLLLDSASVDDAQAAAELRFVWGITTNPALMAREGRPPLVQLKELLGAFPGRIFFQPGSDEVEQAESELREAMGLAPDRVLPKLPARADFVSLAVGLVAEGRITALTAVYSPGQALLAAGAGIDWVIPYVNRAKRLSEHGERLVRDVAAVLASARAVTRVLAASIKSADEVVQAVLDGAAAVSAPLDVLLELDRHPLTTSAIEEFTGHARGLREMGAGKSS